MTTHWKSEEIEILYKYYYTFGASKCHSLLPHRTSQSIRLKANRLGLSTSLGYTNEKYLDKLLEMDLDIIPLEEYIHSTIKINHECKCGNIWKVKPKSILEGNGCPKCASHGINYNLPTILYLVSFVHEDIIYYKIGITTNSVKDRFMGDWTRLNMKLEWEIHLNSGIEAHSLEQSLLKNNHCFLINTGALRAGNTETLTVYVEKPCQ